MQRYGSPLSLRGWVANVNRLCGQVFCNCSRRNRESSRICVVKITQTMKRKVANKYSRIVENLTPVIGKYQLYLISHQAQLKTIVFSNIENTFILSKDVNSKRKLNDYIREYRKRRNTVEDKQIKVHIGRNT